MRGSCTNVIRIRRQSSWKPGAVTTRTGVPEGMDYPGHHASPWA